MTITILRIITTRPQHKLFYNKTDGLKTPVCLLNLTFFLIRQHVIQPVFQRLHRNKNLFHRYSQRDHQKQQRQSESIHRYRLQTDINKERAYHAKQQAHHPVYPHRPGHVKPLAQVINLQFRHRIRTTLVFPFQIPNHLGIRQKTIGIRQHDKRYSGKQNRRGR